jgi:esterase/lipase
MAEMVDHIMPAVKHIKHFLLNNHWESYKRINNIKVPMMFFISENDELVPAQHGEKLFSLATSAKFKNKVKSLKLVYYKERNS